MKDTVRQISGEEVEIFGASRTDSGAHALGQVCHFDTEVAIPPDKWVRALNDRLPADLAILSAIKATSWFHSRFAVIDRSYRYRILTGKRIPQRARFAHWIRKQPDVPAMVEAVKLLHGKHDFRAFTENLDKWIENTNRELYAVSIRKVGPEIWFDVRGTAFLRGMMRRMAGSILEVGLGRRDVDSISRMLNEAGETKDHLPEVLPACGLTLMRVRYGTARRDNRTVLDNDFDRGPENE